MITLTLPLSLKPPSTNELWRPGVNRRTGKPAMFATAKYQRWKRDAGWEIRSQGRKTVSGPYRVTVYVPGNVDADNSLKSLLDLLVELRITPDDSKCVGCRSEREPGRKGVLITITEADQ